MHSLHQTFKAMEQSRPKLTTGSGSYQWEKILAYYLSYDFYIALQLLYITRRDAEYAGQISL